MDILLSAIKKEREYEGILKIALDQFKASKPHPLLITGLCEGAKLLMYSALIKDIKASAGCGCLILVPDEKKSIRIYNGLKELGLNVFLYPYRDLILHDIVSSHEYEHERLGVLSNVHFDTYDAVITCPDAALQYTLPEELVEKNTFTVNSDELYEINDICAKLLQGGYVRTDMVDGRGQFSLRGGILDVFPPAMEYPVRIEFFDTEIEQMGIFDTVSQRKIENIEQFTVSPAREILLNDDSRKKLCDIISREIKRSKNADAKDSFERELSALKNEAEINFLDKYISYIYPDKKALIDYFDGKSFVIFEDYGAIKERLEAYEWQVDQDLEKLLENSTVPLGTPGFGKRKNDLEDFILSNPSAETEMFMRTSISKFQSGIFSIQSRQPASYNEDLKLLCEDLESYRQAGNTVILLTENEISAKNLYTALYDNGINAPIINSSVSDTIGSRAEVYISYGINIPGFELPQSSFVCYSLCQSSVIKNTRKSVAKYRSKKKSSRERIMSYADMEIGDYVVHENYGIGQYMGLKTLTVDGATKDFIKLNYAGNDALYLPCNQLEHLSKYIGAKAEDGTLKLSKMGGTDWIKAKLKVKASAKEMAKELIELYAKRLRLKGFAFGKEEQIERDFANSFEYEETDGQLSAINEIKRDMERDHPMDRLLCGDVGFGKTEVAVRAAFKAVCSQKQVAILVPTTILAMQHYQTFLSRMRGFPVNIDMISRFRNTKQQQESIRKLKRGETDIVIGTHRLVSKDVEFKDLGLVIIDEEQRFGVAQKEKLKQLSSNVDVLTLTATPIPRTLSMSMSGIRDMSILEEAPTDRLPVQTYVLEYDDTIIGEAICKELRRGGQIFYLCNNIERMDSVLARLRNMLPEECKIATAHGQMDKERLSDIWKDLLDGDIDVLISTTIIETGIDIPNANTLIIENADRFGLAQLHQIRGRIGRSSRRAYAYFTYPKGKVLSEIATKRLSSIRDYTEFGSGFKIAIRDLEIRGAGNILGAEQHGHIASVGYDMYMRLLNEAILEEKGEIKEKACECSLDINCDAYIPEKYIKNAPQRIDAYKKISLIRTLDDMMDVCDELLDRYGNMPPSVDNLLKIAMIRAEASKNRITKICHKGASLLIYPESGNMSPWTSLAGVMKGRVLINAGSKPYISIRIMKGESVIALLMDTLKKLSEINKR
ncbi:MAG: transcription-repair coupling factor [Ruminococcaceae bacterium]|nr:transcription-repair coupling factor [Oscillospiraceae bacterium]